MEGLDEFDLALQHVLDVFISEHLMREVPTSLLQHGEEEIFNFLDVSLLLQKLEHRDHRLDIVLRLFGFKRG